jgi:hypothetical protein
VNHVDHTRTDQTSVIRFIEDNWQLGRIGDGSFDVLAGPLTGLFDFSGRHDQRLILDPATGLQGLDAGAAGRERNAERLQLGVFAESGQAQLRRPDRLGE